MKDVPKPRQIQSLKERYPPGTRVELIDMDDPYAKIPPGTKGTVIAVDDIGTVHCQFDNGSSLGLLHGIDSFKRIEPEPKAKDKPSKTPKKKRGYQGVSRRPYEQQHRACSQNAQDADERPQDMASDHRRPYACRVEKAAGGKQGVSW